MILDVVLVIVDQAVSGGVVAGDRAGSGEFGEDDLGELFAEFDAPLIKGVDVPEDALDEDLVLVQSDQRTESARGQLVEHDRVGGLVAFEHLVRDERFERRPLEAGLGQFGDHFIAGLALHERFGLREEVREQDRVMFADGVLAFDGGEEIARDEFRPLVDELVERVLAVRAGFAPDDRAGAVIHAVALTVDALAVAFHVALLEVSGEAMHVLVVRQDGLAGRAMEIVVPDAEQRERDRQIAFEISRAEMFVHFVRSGEERLEVLVADRQGDGETDGRPQRVTAAHPVPEAEHVFRVDTEVRNFLRVGRESDEMLGHGSGVATGGFEQPFFRRDCIGESLLRGEGLRRDDEEGALGRDGLECLGDVCAVDV